MSHHKQMKWAFRNLDSAISTLTETQKHLNAAQGTVDCPKNQSGPADWENCVSIIRADAIKVGKLISEYLGKERP